MNFGIIELDGLINETMINGLIETSFIIDPLGTIAILACAALVKRPIQSGH